MHLVILLVAIGALITGLAFVAETYSAYQVHFFVLTVLYFVAWFIASRQVSERASVTYAPDNSAEHDSLGSGYFARFGKFSFLEVTSFYVAGVSLLFAAALLVAGHTFRAWMVVAFGFGLAIGMAAASEQSTK